MLACLHLEPPKYYCPYTLFSLHSTITLVGGKKRKRNGSSDHSDVDLSPPVSPRTMEEDMSQVPFAQEQ